MSRRKLLHAKLDRQVHVIENKHSAKVQQVEIVTRGNAANYRAKHGIEPRGLRNGGKGSRRAS